MAGRRFWIRRPPVGEEVRDELDFHLEMRTRELIAAGMSPSDARVEAQRRLGDQAGLARRLGTLGRHRDRRLWVAELGRDVRHAFRGLVREPGFLLIAFLTLGVGIGVNTAVFSVVRGVLLAPFPYPDADRLVAIGESEAGRDPNGLGVTSPGNFGDWRSQGRSFSSLAAYGDDEFATLTGRGEPERVLGVETVGDVFGVLGVRAALGRVFSDRDGRPDAAPTVLLSDHLWRRRFGADRAMLGQSLVLNGTARTVIGVMPPGFNFPDETVEFWSVAQFSEAFRANRDQYQLAVIGRLAPGTTLDAARAEMGVIAGRLRVAYPKFNSRLEVHVLPWRTMVVSAVAGRLLLLLMAVALLLLLAVANLGSLVLARGLARGRELAVRQALGAGRGRLNRQLVTEHLVLALIGSAGGVAIGWVVLRGLIASLPDRLPRMDAIRLDGGVLAFSLGLALIVGVSLGLLPVWQTARIGAASVLRGSRAATGREGRSRSVLLSGQLALATVLTLTAGLVVASLRRLATVETGVTSGGVLTFRVNLARPDPRFFDAALGRFGATAGVRRVAVTTQVPLTGRGWGAWFNLIDRPLPPDQTPIGEAVRVVSPDYFAALDIPILHGRGFGPGDDRDHPAVVVNAALARRYWPSGDPLGHEIYLGAPDNRVVDHATVVGVVGDTRDAGAALDPLPTVFLPFRMMSRLASLSFVLRTDGDPMAAAPLARRIVRELDSGAPIDQVHSLREIAAARLGPTRWLAGLLSAFAVLALAVALVGVFGTVTYLVSQRTRELGIRKALGASSGAIARLVVTHTIGITLAGVVAGLGVATLGGRFLRTLLYGISPTDAGIFTGVGLLLLAAAALASAWPAWRAGRIDPAITLKSD